MKKYKYSYTIGRRTVKGYLTARNRSHAEELLDALINECEFTGTDPYAMQRFHIDSFQLTEVIEQEPRPEKLQIIPFWLITVSFIAFMLICAFISWKIRN